jgi:hypothetical protein
MRKRNRALSAALAGVMSLLLRATPGHAEVSVDVLYDLRHATDPRDNPNNFPVLELKAFFPLSFGSFLLKEEMDLDGASHNVSQVYTELSQSVKLGSLMLGQRPLYAHLGYSGGLGLFANATGGYYIRSAYNVGLEYPFEARKAFCDVFVALRRTSLAQPSYDPMLAVYAGRYFFKDKLLVANSLEAWTASYDQTPSRAGKYASWELESEAWYKIAKHLSVGTYVRTTRNVYALSNRWLLFPSFGVRYVF